MTRSYASAMSITPGLTKALRRRPLKRFVPCLLVATVFFASCGDSSEYGIVAADGSIDGSTVAELSQAASKAVIEAPMDRSFLIDVTNCDMGASTDEVYFAPTWPDVGDHSVTCTMQSGQAALFMPVGFFCIEDEIDIADVSCLDEGWDVTSSSLSIDGKEIDLSDRIYSTEAYEVVLVEDNIFEMEPAATLAISRMQTVVVTGLSKGTHDVILAGDFGEGEFSGRMLLTLVVE